MKKCFLLCTVSFFAAIACTREAVAPEEPETVNNGPIPVTLLVGEPGTRTELKEVNGEIHPWWSKGDGISVIPYPGGGVSEFDVFDFSSDLESAASTAAFSGLPDEPGKYIAVYPQQKQTYDPRWGEYVYNPDVYGYNFGNGEVDLSFTLPTVQHPSLTSFDPDADLLISDPFDINVEDYNEELNKVIVEGVSFTRVNAIVKIVLNPQTSLLEGQTVRRVTIGTDAFTSGGDSPEPMNVAAGSTRACIYDRDEDDDYADHGLGGRMNFEIYSDNVQTSFNGWESVTAEYGDETYQIGDNGPATYLVTFPGILMNAERYDEETGSSIFDDGLHIRVETDDLIIDRNVVLPPNGIALQPSRVTTLNIKLYDDGVQGTTILTIGMALNEESVSLKPGKGMQLAAQFIGIDPDSDELEDLVWTSSDNNVVAVEPVCHYYGGELRSGVVAYTNLANITAISEGTATITATYKGKYVATCAVTVANIPEQPSQMVDLGLPSGTKWSQWSLGAQSWDQEGDLYAWGETQYKSIFSWDNYEWAAGQDVLTKYTTSALFTTDHQIDHKFLLDLEDDAAYENWGSDWYTPTQEQWEELRDYCTWDFVYDDDDNVIGCTATGSNGNSIYFPSREKTYYFDSFLYMCSKLPKPNRGDWKEALTFYQTQFDVHEAWSQELGNHNSIGMYYYTPKRGEEGAYIRPVSGGLSLRKEYTEDDLGAITVPSSDGTVKARFPVYESEREQSYKNDPQYEYYAATAVILYSTDPEIEPCNYFWGHRATDNSGSYDNGRYVRFSLDEYEENQVCSFVPEGMTGTVYYRAYYYSTVKKRKTDSNSIQVNEKWGVTRSITIQ